MTTHCVVPDVQFKPGNDGRFLERIGEFLVDRQPEVIIQIGDFADLPSLSSYDVGKKSFEGRPYTNDIAAAQYGMECLLGPIERYNAKQQKNGKKQYKPRKILTLGNHEHRITRVIESDARLDGTISLTDLGYERFGWEVYPFLQPVFVDGIAYAHYFVSGAMGRPVTNARMLLLKKHMSCTMGHNQNWDICRDTRADGKPVIGLFCGSCYEHNEDYLGPQGNNYDRGVWMKYEVSNSSYFPHFISLDYLKKKYK